MYNLGFWNSNRLSVGAFYFDYSPLFVNVNVDAEIIDLFLDVPEATIYTYKNFELDFIGVPQKRSSPLSVSFSATVNMLGDVNRLYEVDNYEWYFDYDRDLSVSATSETNTTIHEYSGYYGKKYSVRCKVNLIAK